MGRSVTTFGILTVFVLLALVIGVIWLGSRNPPQTKPQGKEVAQAGKKSQAQKKRIPIIRKAKKPDRVVSPKVASPVKPEELPAGLGRAVSGPGASQSQPVIGPARPKPAQVPVSAPPLLPRSEGPEKEPELGGRKEVPEEGIADLPTPADQILPAPEPEKPEEGIGPEEEFRTEERPVPEVGEGLPSGGEEDGAGLASQKEIKEERPLKLAEPPQTSEVREEKAETVSQEKPLIHIVRQGDTLWQLALEYYHDGTKWTKIQEANARILGQSKVLLPGTKLKIPPLEKKTAAKKERSSDRYVYYTVKKGDRIWDIAKRLYDDPDMWLEILAANPGLDSTAMPVGKKIRLPKIPGKGPIIPPEEVK